LAGSRRPIYMYAAGASRVQKQTVVAAAPPIFFPLLLSFLPAARAEREGEEEIRRAREGEERSYTD